MRRIATTRQLQGELETLLRYASQASPSRSNLARALADLSLRVATSMFHPGQIVAYVETRPHNLDIVKELYTIKKVKSVGKRDVKVDDSNDRFDPATGQSREKGVYQWRAIKPLTPELIEWARKKKAFGLDLLPPEE